MIFVKSESKRKNVITSLVVVLLIAGGIMLDSNLSQKTLSEDCSCLGQVQVQQEAGWFFGRHTTRRGRCVQRVFGITVGPCKVECATYE